MNSPEIVYHPLIIPTIVIPFAFVLAGVSALATFIAGLFGVKLKAEGPKKLLEVLLKPRVLFTALIANVAFVGIYQLYHYWANSPASLWRIEREQAALAQPSKLDYSSKSETLQRSPSAPSTSGEIEVVWTRNLAAGSFRGAVIAGESAFVGLDSGFIRELSLSTGDIRRSFYVGTSVSAAVTVHHGSLYAGEGVHDTHHARVYKYDLRSGQLLATFSTRGHVEGETAVAETSAADILLIPSGSEGLNAIDAKSMQKIWRAKDGHVDAGPAYADGIAFSATGLEKKKRFASSVAAYAYDITTGQKRWSQELPASSWMRPLLWRDKVCFIYGEVYFVSGLGGVICFDQKNGTADIAYNHATPVVSELVLVGNDILMSDIKGKVCRVSLENGREKWCQLTGKAQMSFSGAAFDSKWNVVIYASENEGVFVFDATTGAVLTKWKAEKQPLPWSKTLAPVAVTTDGWIIVDSKGVARKLRWKAKAINVSQDR